MSARLYRELMLECISFLEQNALPHRPVGANERKKKDQIRQMDFRSDRSTDMLANTSSSKWVGGMIFEEKEPREQRERDSGEKKHDTHLLWFWLPSLRPP